MTPLHCACAFGNGDAAEALLDAGADRAALDAYGRDPAQACPPGSALLSLFARSNQG
jgi:ankyrin repeat protein